MLNGKPVDFSRAWTMYHPTLDLVRLIHFLTLRKTKVLDLEQLIHNSWVQNPASFPMNFKLAQGLLKCTSEIDDCGADPRAYNWRARVKEGFMPQELFRSQNTPQ